MENAGIKKKVLGELERKVHDNTIIASNTSTISIDELASAVQRPENFCGMHFFNPVPVMPLVEVIRGAASSDRTVATTVAYAKALGKTPIVVNNCPGFLVNRILFPYFGAFSALIRDGAEFSQIDRVMEKFGWPMGPAYLLDVVGIDTAVHCQHVLADGFARACPLLMRALSTYCTTRVISARRPAPGFTATKPTSGASPSSCRVKTAPD